MAWAIETCCQLISGKQTDSQTMPRQVKHWQLPGKGAVKINVDGRTPRNQTLERGW
jgi:hypothetical protein